MPNQKMFIRVIAIVLALIMIIGVVFVALNVIASAAPYSSVPAAVSHSYGDNFSIAVVIVFLVALAVLIAFLAIYFINKRKK